MTRRGRALAPAGPERARVPASHASAARRRSGGAGPAGQRNEGRIRRAVAEGEGAGTAAAAWSPWFFYGVSSA
jgi:hypothetical protein